MSSKKKNKKKIFWKILIVVICTLGPIAAWLGFGEQGLIHLYHTEMERQAYIERILQLKAENQALLDEINRLRNDLKYVESVARKRFNMIKPNEVIYKFSDEKQHNNDAKALAVKAQNGDNIGKTEREELHDDKLK